MPMENIKPNIIEMAKKKRHLYLLEKLQKGKNLTRAELRELARYEGGQLPPGVVETQSQVAKAFKVSVRTVQFWTAEGMPIMPDGHYDITEIQAWRLLKGDRKGKGSDKDEAKGWDAKYRQMKALLAEIDYKKALGQLIPRDEVEAGRVQRIIAIKKAFLSFPQIVAPQLVGLEPRQIQVIINQRVTEIIERFSQDKKDKKNVKSRTGSAMVRDRKDSVAAPGKNNSITVG